MYSKKGTSGAVEIRLALLIGCLLWSLFGCGTKTLSPSEVVESFHQNIAAGQLEAAVSLSLDSQELPADHFKSWLQRTTRVTASKGGLEKVEIIDEQTIGETSEVVVNLVYGDGTEERHRSSLMQIDGKWRIQRLAMVLGGGKVQPLRGGKR